MAKKRIKRRISKEALNKRKEFNSVIVSPNMLNKKMPEKEKQKEYVKSLIKDFDEKLKV